MTLADLFDWTRSGMFGDIRRGQIGGAGVVRRNAQMHFARRLAQLWIAPAAGTPTDAQALARLQLEYLSHDVAVALRGKQTEITRAHLEALGRWQSGARRARDDGRSVRRHGVRPLPPISSRGARCQFVTVCVLLVGPASAKITPAAPANAPSLKLSVY